MMAKKTFEPRPGETVFAERVTADCWKTPKQTLGRQVSGKAYFTDQRIVFLASGLIGTAGVSWEIELKDVQSVETCMTPPCFPFGILLTMWDGGKYKLGVMKRSKYVDWISGHIS
mgnify:CR=1 FL=1